MRTRWALGVALALCAQAAALGGAALRLSGIPDRLAFPLPEGTNQVLTAKVTGAEAKSVWLATAKDAAARVMLSAVGEGEYQVNLANPAVAAVLLARDDRRQFQVFAETAEGQALASVAVRYTRRRPARRAKPACWVRCGEERRPVVSLRRVRQWFAPDQVTQLEVRFDAAAADPAARAVVGQQSWPFAAAKQQNIRQLAMTPAIRKAWQDGGTLGVYCEQDGGDAGSFTLYAVPQRLDLPEEPPRLTIIQRRSRALPGSRGYLGLAIGDITAGQTLLTLRTDDDKPLIDSLSMRPDDEVPFAFGGHHYKLRLVNLVNVLIGDDHATFTVAPLPEAERRASDAARETIEQLIAALEKSDLRFIREGVELSAAQGAARLRKKVELAGPKLLTVDTFIDRIASRSWLTGNDYLLKHPDGKTVKAGDWFRHKAKDLAAKQD